MIAAWIAYSLLAGALVAGAACAIATAARIVKLPTRWIWSAAMAATVVLSGIAPFRGGETNQPVTLTVGAKPLAPAATARPAGLGDAISAAKLLLVESTRRTLAGVEHVLVPGTDRWVGIGAIVLAGFAVLLLAAVYVRYARLRHHWPTSEVAGMRVRVSPDTGPAVIGVARAEIVVPRWLLERSAREQALVIAHEAEHVRARDPLLLGLGCVAVALMPWHPAVWWMLAQLRLAVELDCDARVLRRGVAPRAYGSLLIDLAGRCSGFPAGAPALADTPSHLERRLVAMRRDRIRFPLFRAAASSALALAALLAACEAKLPTDADVKQMNVASAEQGAVQLNLRPGHDSLTRYVIDGRVATAEEAHALQANQIATVNVTKSQEPNGHAEVQISTRGDAERTRLSESGSVEPGSSRLRAEMAGAEPRAKDTFTGLVYIDGERSEMSALKTLSRDEIVSVNVMKGDAATKLYSDPAAANGVIVVTTVKAKK